MPTYSVQIASSQKYSRTQNSRSISITYIVTSFIGSIDALQAELAVDDVSGLSIPQLGVYYPGSGELMACSSLEASNLNDNNQVWSVTAHFNYPVTAGLSNASPLDLPVQWTMQIQEVQTPKPRDVHGNALVFSSREPANINRPTKEIVLIATKWIHQSAFSMATCYTYTGSVNSADWSPSAGLFGTFAKNTVHCDAVIPKTPIAVGVSGTSIIQMEYKFHIRTEDTWQYRLLDSAYTVWDSDNSKTVQAIDDTTSQPVTAPIMLNGLGGRKGTTDGAVLPDSITIDSSSIATFLLYDIYPPQNFSTLGL